MYIIRNKVTKEILSVSATLPGENLQPEKIYPVFDAKTMEYGVTDLSYIPSDYSISDEHVIIVHAREEKPAEDNSVAGPHQKLVDGEIVEKTIQELIDDGLVTLAQVKQSSIDRYSLLSFQKRRELIPDYQLENASLGIYDEQRIAGYRATVQAFRDESLRIRGLIEKAKTLDEVQAIRPDFPTEVITALKKNPES